MQKFIDVQFSRGSVLGRLIKNKLLAIPTFGLYRFWGKTHLRRLLWQSVRVEGERLVYHGTAGELFIGFLIAIAFLAGVSFLFNLLVGVSIFASGSENPLIVVGSQVIYSIGFFALIAFARYRLWRYRLSRTSLSTVRFYQLGRGTKYAGLSLLWGFLSLISLGAAYPKMRQVLLDYQINHVHYGVENFSFSGQVKPLYKIYWPWIVSTIISMLCLGAAIGFTLYVNEIGPVFDADDPAKIQQDMTMLALQVATFIAFVFSGVAFFVGRVLELRYVVANTRFAGAHFECGLSSKAIISTVVKRGLFVAMLGAIPVVLAPAFLEATTMPDAGGIYFIMSFIILMFVYMLLFDIVIFMMLFIPVFEKLASSILVDREGVFKATAMTSQNSPKYGEGFADALDVGAF